MAEMLATEKELSPEEFENEILSIFKESLSHTRIGSNFANFTGDMHDGLKRKGIYFELDELGLAIVKLVSKGHLKAHFGYNYHKKHLTMIIYANKDDSII